jgi:transcriptional regulator with XRE-family HTH domain
MDSWRSAGDLLRWWRTSVLGWTQQQTAERLNVRPNALSNWERGERAISIDLRALDEALDGGRLLADLLWSRCTPEGLEPGRLWSHVFPGESRPVWLWLRSLAPRVVIEAEWGVARLEDCFELGPNGLFITVGASLPDSPVVVQISEPAWVDFGSGTPPPVVPGAEVVSAVELMKRSSARGPLMDMFSSTLESKVASRAPGAVDLAATAPGAIDSYLDRRGRRGRDGWTPMPEGVDAIERRRYARLRHARGLSLAALAARLQDQTDLDVGRDTLRRFETDVGQPHHPQLPVALDHVLGAGGRLAVLDLRHGHGEGSVSFPPYWRGPFWVEFGGPEELWPVTLVLRRGHWHREVHLDGPRLVSAHWFDPAVPLRIAAPASLGWTVGVGRRAGAKAIDQDWVPATMDVAQQAVSEIEDAIYGAVRSSREGGRGPVPGPPPPNGPPAGGIPPAGGRPFEA